MSVPPTMVPSLPKWFPTLDSPPKLVYGGIMILLIVYSSALPSAYRSFADSLFGRIGGMLLVAVALEGLGWVYGLLTAVAFLLILHHAPRIGEGFDGGGTISEKRTVGDRWFIEKVLGERPKKIAIDHVSTSAIQD